MTNTDPICKRILFKNADNQTEPLVPEWTSEQVNTAKRRSALLKPLILYLQDDKQRRAEEIELLPAGDGAKATNTWIRETLSTRISQYLGLEDDLKQFLRSDHLTSDKFAESNNKHMPTFCKCAWICKAPPEAFKPFSKVTSFSDPTKILASAPVKGADAPTITTNEHPWKVLRECDCSVDTCTCSAELAEMCLWLGWETEFKKHLRVAIWTGSIESVKLITPVEPLRGLGGKSWLISDSTINSKLRRPRS